MRTLTDLMQLVITGQASETKNCTQELLAAGVGAEELLQQGLNPAMAEVSRQFKENIIYIPDVLMASRAMHAAMQVLKPILSECRSILPGRVVIGTVAGDLHDIGKNLVVMMMRGKGLEVIDLGIDVTPEAFVEAVREYRPQILGMSALLTTTMSAMNATIQALIRAGLRDQVRVMVGGGPVTGQYCSSIGADDYASDARIASELAVQSLGNAKL